MHKVGCEEPGLSDSLIYSQISCKVERKKHAIRTVRCLGRCDVDSLVDDLDSAPWNLMDSLEDADSQWAYWKKLFEVSCTGQSEEEKSTLE